MSQTPAQNNLTPPSTLPVDTYPPGAATALAVTTATVLKAAPGRLVRVHVVVAGSAAGSANDAATTGAAGIGNQIATLPNTVGPILIDWPCATGIVIMPGTGQTLAAAYY
jgi:hypothetical protein